MEENKRYDALLIGPIRKWWDGKTREEKTEIIYDVANTVIGVTLIVGTAYGTAKIMEAKYKKMEDEKKVLNTRYSQSDIFFSADTENDIAEIAVFSRDPSTGDIKPVYRMTGDIDNFKKTSKAFTDASSYIKSKSAENQYAKVIYGLDGLRKYHKPM